MVIAILLRENASKIVYRVTLDTCTEPLCKIGYFIHWQIIL